MNRMAHPKKIAGLIAGRMSGRGLAKTAPLTKKESPPISISYALIPISSIAKGF